MVLSPSLEGRLTPECPTRDKTGYPRDQCDSPLLYKKQEMSHMANAGIQKYPELGSAA